MFTCVHCGCDLVACNIVGMDPFVAKNFQDILCSHGPGSRHEVACCQYCDLPVDEATQPVHYTTPTQTDHYACVPGGSHA